MLQPLAVNVRNSSVPLPIGKSKKNKHGGHNDCRHNIPAHFVTRFTIAGLYCALCCYLFVGRAYAP
jgi:hypothetical protein